MPVPSSITDLSTTAASNSPAGTDAISNTLDDYLRAIQAIIRSESLNKSWEAPGHTPTYLSATQFTVPTDLTSTYTVGRRIKATLAGPTYAYSTITASAFAADVTTVTVANDSTALSSPISAIEVGPNIIAMMEAGGSRIASRAWVQALTASDSQAGIIEIATNAEAQAGTDTARAVTPAGVKAAQIIQLTSVSASGASVDFTGIPSWAKRITIMFDSLSTNGTSVKMVRLGNAGGIESTGYLSASCFSNNSTGAVSIANYTDGFALTGVNAADAQHGSVVLNKLTGNTWICSGNIAFSSGGAFGTVAGSKTTSATLDRVRVTTSGGTDTFDAGNINIFYE